MTKCYTHFDTPKIIPTEPGDEYLEVYQEELLKDGTKGLVCTGKKNIYAMIQEDLESTKIENILKAVAMGDLTVLRQQEPVYIDATTMPKNLMEAQNIVIKAKSEFDKMPEEVRKLFDYNADLYVSEMGTKDWLDKMEPYNNKIKAVKEAGSAAEYNKRVAQQAQFEKDVAAAKGGTTE